MKTSWRRAIAVATLTVAVLVPCVARAADPSSVGDYRVRVDMARTLLDEAVGRSLDQRQASDLAGELNTLLPASEHVRMRDGVVDVDNSILRSLVARLDAADDSVTRHDVVDDIAGHIASLDAAMTRGSTIEQDRDALDTIIASQRADRRSTISAWLGRLVDRIVTWLADWWESAGASPATGTAITVALAVAAATLILVLAIVITRVLVRMWRGTTRSGRPVRGAPAVEGVIPAAADLPADPLAFADRLAASGQYREAMRALFGGAARAMLEQGYVPQTRTLTNGELVAIVSSRVPAVIPPLDRLRGAFERTWYGHRDTGTEEFAKARGWYEDVLSLSGSGGVSPGGEAA